MPLLKGYIDTPAEPAFSLLASGEVALHDEENDNDGEDEGADLDGGGVRLTLPVPGPQQRRQPHHRAGGYTLYPREQQEQQQQQQQRSAGRRKLRASEPAHHRSVMKLSSSTAMAFPAWYDEGQMTPRSQTLGSYAEFAGLVPSLKTAPRPSLEGSDDRPPTDVRVRSSSSGSRTPPLQAPSDDNEELRVRSSSIGSRAPRAVPPPVLISPPTTTANTSTTTTTSSSISNRSESNAAQFMHESTRVLSEWPGEVEGGSLFLPRALEEQSSDVSLHWTLEFWDVLDKLQAASTVAEQRDALLGLARVNLGFVRTAKLYARQIIQERHMSVDQKTIKPAPLGGVAGGEKFVQEGIVFKFAADFHGLYGGDTNAACAAGQELISLNAIAEAQYRQSIKFPMHLPLATCIDFHGYRMLCTSLLPLGKFAPRRRNTLVYGSPDGGVHVARVKEFADDIDFLGGLLNLKRHRTGSNPSETKDLVFPGDCEVHVHRDASHIPRLFMLDAARLFPPEVPTGLPQFKTEFLWRHMRPEFVKRYKKPLCADAFAKFQRHDPHANENNQDIAQACREIFDEVVPAFARFLRTQPHLDEGKLQRSTEPSRKALAVTAGTSKQHSKSTDFRSSDPAFQGSGYIQLSRTCSLSLGQLMHNHGLNIRHLGALWLELLRPLCQGASRSHCSNCYWVFTLLDEMIVRVCKQLCRAIWRRIPPAPGRVMSEDPFKKKMVDFLNLAFIDTPASRSFWQQELLQTVLAKFFYSPALRLRCTLQEGCLQILENARDHVDLGRMFRRLPDLLGVEVASNRKDENLSPVHLLDVQDLISIQARGKWFGFAITAEGVHHWERSKTLEFGSVDAHRACLQACRCFHAALSEPVDTSSILIHRTWCQSTLALLNFNDTTKDLRGDWLGEMVSEIQTLSDFSKIICHWLLDCPSDAPPSTQRDFARDSISFLLCWYDLLRHSPRRSGPESTAIFAREHCPMLLLMWTCSDFLQEDARPVDLVDELFPCNADTVNANSDRVSPPVVFRACDPWVSHVASQGTKLHEGTRFEGFRRTACESSTVPTLREFKDSVCLKPLRLILLGFEAFFGLAELRPFLGPHVVELAVGSSPTETVTDDALTMEILRCCPNLLILRCSSFSLRPSDIVSFCHDKLEVLDVKILSVAPGTFCGPFQSALEEPSLDTSSLLPFDELPVRRAFPSLRTVIATQVAHLAVGDILSIALLPKLQCYSLWGFQTLLSRHNRASATAFSRDLIVERIAQLIKVNGNTSMRIFSVEPGSGTRGGATTPLQSLYHTVDNACPNLEILVADAFNPRLCQSFGNPPDGAESFGSENDNDDSTRVPFSRLLSLSARPEQSQFSGVRPAERSALVVNMLRHLPSLTKISLTSDMCTFEVLQSLPTTLRSFRFTPANKGDIGATLEMLARTPIASGLESLAVAGSGYLGDCAVAALSNFKQLKSLRMGDNVGLPVRSKTVSFLSAFVSRVAARLEVLQITLVLETYDSMRAISFCLGKLVNLKELHLRVSTRKSIQNKSAVAAEPANQLVRSLASNCRNLIFLTLRGEAIFGNPSHALLLASSLPHLSDLTLDPLQNGASEVATNSRFVERSPLPVGGSGESGWYIVDAFGLASSGHDLTMFRGLKRDAWICLSQFWRVHETAFATPSPRDDIVIGRDTVG